MNRTRKVFGWLALTTTPVGVVLAAWASVFHINFYVDVGGALFVTGLVFSVLALTCHMVYKA